MLIGHFGTGLAGKKVAPTPSLGTLMFAAQFIDLLWPILILLGLLLAIYVGGLIGPPPPAVESIAIVGLSQWLFVLWAYWIDRNRENRFSPR